MQSTQNLMAIILTDWKVSGLKGISRGLLKMEGKNIGVTMDGIYSISGRALRQRGNIRIYVNGSAVTGDHHNDTLAHISLSTSVIIELKTTDVITFFCTETVHTSSVL